MTPPKKPGTDLSALKARLAKKSGPSDAPEPAASIPAPGESKPPRKPKPKPAATIPAPGAVIPAPGEVIPAPGQSIPAPGEYIPAPGEQLPPPGHVAAPEPPPADPRKEGAFSNSPSAFDPNDGLIDSGPPVEAKGSKGLVAFAAGGAMVLGIVFGFMIKGTLDKRERITQAMDKGKVMHEEAVAVSEMRKGISLGLEDVKKRIAEDPKAGAEALKELNATNFEKHPKVDALFGRELATIHGNDIKRVFQLYEEANGLKTDLGSLTNFVAANASSLAKEGGPSSFGVLSKEDGITLVEVVQPMCPGEGEDPAPCTPDTVGNAIGYLVRDKLGAEPSFAPTGGGAGQVRPISSGDEMYLYLVGQNPENNAKILYQRMLGNVQTRLEDMNKVERRAIKALAKFSDDPESAGEETAEE